MEGLVLGSGLDFIGVRMLGFKDNGQFSSMLFSLDLAFAILLGLNWFEKKLKEP